MAQVLSMSAMPPTLAHAVQAPAAATAAAAAAGSASLALAEPLTTAVAKKGGKKQRKGAQPALAPAALAAGGPPLRQIIANVKELEAAAASLAVVEQRDTDDNFFCHYRTFQSVRILQEDFVIQTEHMYHASNLDRLREMNEREEARRLQNLFQVGGGVFV